MTERRKAGQNEIVGLAKPTTLPSDYLQMVQEVFTTTFEGGLNALKSMDSKPYFVVQGEIFADEIMLRASLLFDGQIAATTAYASSDFDPAANSPKLEELLGSCVDALGAIFTLLLDPARPAQLENLRGDSLSALEDVPYEWSKTEINQRDIFVRVDKANPSLDRLTDEWLAKNDPNFKESQESNLDEAEELMEDRIQQLEEDKNRRGGSGGPTFH